jgi:hypothetical protein
MVFEHGGEYDSQWAAITSIADPGRFSRFLRSSKALRP